MLFVGAGTILFMGVHSLPLGPIPTPNEAHVTTSTEEPNAARTLVHSPINANSAMLITPATAAMSSLEKLEARVIKNHRIAEYMKSLYPYTPVNIPLLHELLKSHPNQEFVSKLCTGLSSGFRVGYTGGCFPRTASNLPSARQHPHVIEDNLLEEIQLGWLAGPFESPPFVNLQVHPLGLVPKKNSHKWRTILHLSHPKGSSQSLNAHIPIQEYTLQYIRVDDAIALILKHGPGCFMTKTDIQSAFRIIPIHPEDWELLGMAWKGFYYFDKTLPFGLRSAPPSFSIYSLTP